MRFTDIKNKIFPNDLTNIEIVKKQELDKRIKTKKVLLALDAFTKSLNYFISKGRTEAICLLRGRVCGEYLLVSDVFCCPDAKATYSSVKIPEKSFVEAGDIKDNNYIIGWSHDHPGFKVFMSGTDRATQTDFQALFPDAVAMVMNPFSKNGIDFKFFRYNENGDLKKLKYDFLVSGYED